MTVLASIIRVMLYTALLFAVIYGIAHGGFFTSISPIVAEYFGINTHGVLFGTVVFSGTIGGSFGPFLAGYIFIISFHGFNVFWRSLSSIVPTRKSVNRIILRGQT